MQEIFTVKNIVIYFITINLIGFFIMWLDKRKAKKGAWRIPEKTLFIITALGGGIGTIADPKNSVCNRFSSYYNT